MTKSIEPERIHFGMGDADQSDRCSQCGTDVFYSPGMTDEGYEQWQKTGQPPYDADGRFYIYCKNKCRDSGVCYVESEAVMDDIRKNGVDMCGCCKEKESAKLERALNG